MTNGIAGMGARDNSRLPLALSPGIRRFRPRPLRPLSPGITSLFDRTTNLPQER